MSIPDGGRIETAEAALPGEGYRQEYLYVLADGSQREAQVGGGFSVTDLSPADQLRWYFFIGTPADYERYKRLYGYDPEALRLGRLPAGSN